MSSQIGGPPLPSPAGPIAGRKEQNHPLSKSLPDFIPHRIGRNRQIDTLHLRPQRTRQQANLNMFERHHRSLVVRYLLPVARHLPQLASPHRRTGA